MPEDFDEEEYRCDCYDEPIACPACRGEFLADKF